MKKPTLITAIVVLGAIIFITIMISVKAQEEPDQPEMTSSQQTTNQPAADDDNQYDPNEQEYHNQARSSTK